MAFRCGVGGLTVIAACGDAASPAEQHPDTAPDIAVELGTGTGTDGFTPLADGDTVPITHGPDGGWWIGIAGRLTHSEPEISVFPSVSLGAEIITNDTQDAVYLALSDGGTFPEVRAFVDAMYRPSGPTGIDWVCSLAGQTVTVSVVVADLVSLREATGSVDVVLALDPHDVAFCRCWDPEAEISLQVGTGVDKYVPLTDGDAVTMVHGLDGRWHVETAGLVDRSDEEITVLPTIRSTVLGRDITAEQEPEYRSLRYPEGECAGTFSGVRATLRETGPTGQAVVCGLAGQTAMLSMRVADFEGTREATTDVDVILALDPADVSRCP